MVGIGWLVCAVWTMERNPHQKCLKRGETRAVVPLCRRSQWVDICSEDVSKDERRRFPPLCSRCRLGVLLAAALGATPPWEESGI